MPWAHEPVTLEHEETVARQGCPILARQDMMLLLILKNTNTLIGGSGLHRFDWDVPRFEIGYWARRAMKDTALFQKQSMASPNLPLKAIGRTRNIHMDHRNIRSWRMPPNAAISNMKAPCAIMLAMFAGGLRETWIYSKIRSDWLEDTQEIDGSCHGSTVNDLRHYEGKYFFSAAI